MVVEVTPSQREKRSFGLLFFLWKGLQAGGVGLALSCGSRSGLWWVRAC